MELTHQIRVHASTFNSRVLGRLITRELTIRSDLKAQNNNQKKNNYERQELFTFGQLSLVIDEEHKNCTNYFTKCVGETATGLSA